MNIERSGELFPGPRPAAADGEARPPRAPRPAPRPAKRPPPPRRRSARGGPSLLRRVGSWLLVAGIWCGVLLGAVLAYFAYDLPDIRKIAQAERRPAVVVLAADGNEFARFGDLHGTVVDSRALPRHLVNAVVAIEDRRFFSHFGIDPIGLARAVYVNWRTGRTAQGGSTLTQQLAKNLFLSPERSLKRKVQEAMLAFWLENRFSKDQILTAYLNRVYLGAGTYGVDAAARTYFGKPATAVTLMEAATIAGLLKAPSRYAPSSNPDEAAERARVVLAAMEDGGFITAEERQAALAAPPPGKARTGGDGRYFADWVTELVEGYIGAGHGDVTVRTTLDLNLQRAAEKRVEEMLAGPAVPAKAGQAALVAMSPDGAVRALVGGRDFGASEFNRATQALRQPGSAFKPFVYLAALEAGWTPETTVEDAPVQIGTWSPGNYDGRYRGTVTLAQALAHSSNTATVRVIERVGVERVRRLATALGITSRLTPDLSLALGTSEVTLLDLTRAYAGIASRGASVMPYAVQEIRDRDGTVLYRRKPGGGTTVTDPALAVQLARMMTGVLEFGTGRSAKLDRPAAAKSGTTQDYRDAWFVGFTADLVAGVWLGNDNNSEMNKVTGGTLPAQLWRAFMLDAHRGLKPRPLPGLEGLPVTTVAAAPARATQSPPSAAPASGIGGLIERLSGSAPRVQYDWSNDNPH